MSLQRLRMDRVSSSLLPSHLGVWQKERPEGSLASISIQPHLDPDPLSSIGMTDETFEEIETYFEMLDSRLVFKGFMQLYQLQAENDEEETSKDLVAWGYDLETLELKYTVAEEKEEKEVEEDEVKGKEENVKEV